MMRRTTNPLLQAVAWGTASLLGVGACATPVGDDIGLQDQDADGNSASGGVASSGGAPIGSGGIAATAGGAPSGGASGGAGTGGGSTSCPPVDGDAEFQAAYISGDVSDSTAYVNSTLKIVKTGTPVPLSELKLRYYFTNEVPAPTVNVNWTQPLGGITGTYTTTATIEAMTVAGSDADYYVEFTFSGNDLSGAIKFSWQMAAPNPDEFDQTDDYSFGPPTGSADADFTVTDKLVLLRNDVVVWGTPPC